jgi:FSR family fosmidomycin resistance protein-like MFS transporter
VLLAIELLDELAFGVQEAAWPLLRDELGLTYADVGLLVAVPNLVATTVEPLFGLLGDAGRRRGVVVAGGAAFALALAGWATAGGFVPLLAAFVLLATASGAFVSLAQATLVDLHPRGPDAAMARWALAGSAGVTLAPLALAGAVALGVGWRGVVSRSRSRRPC